MRYLPLTFLYVMLMLGAVGAFNYSVDPYVVFHYPTATASKLNRIDQFWNMRLNKPYQFDQVHPRVVIIGSSRSGRLRPACPSVTGPTYNYSVPGMTAEEMKTFIGDAAHKSSVQRIVVGLDPEMFMLADATSRLGFSQARMEVGQGVTGLRHLWQQIKDYRVMLLSTSATMDSFVALRHRHYLRHYRLDGGWSWRGWKGEPSYVLLARLWMMEYPKNKADGFKQEALRQILQRLYQSDKKAVIIAMPEHLFEMLIWQDTGYWPMLRKWHQTLVRLNTQIAHQYHKTPFPIWGFNTLDGIVNEPILPSAQSKHSWFKDGIHFQPPLGKRIYATMMCPPGPGRLNGIRLTPSSLPDYWQHLTTMTNDYRRQKAADIASLYHKIGLAFDPDVSVSASGARSQPAHQQ